MRRSFVLWLVSIIRGLVAVIPMLGSAAFALLDLLLLLTGLGLIVGGIAHWSAPAAYIAAGIGFIALGTAPMRRRA